MKIVIDIPEVYYKLCKVCVDLNTATPEQQLIADGIVLPENTNLTDMERQTIWQETP